MSHQIPPLLQRGAPGLEAEQPAGEQELRPQNLRLRPRARLRPGRGRPEPHRLRGHALVPRARGCVGDFVEHWNWFFGACGLKTGLVCGGDCPRCPGLFSESNVKQTTVVASNCVLGRTDTKNHSECSTELGSERIHDENRHLERGMHPLRGAEEEAPVHGKRPPGPDPENHSGGER